MANKIDEILCKNLSPDADLAKCLKNMPAAWLDGICLQLGLQKASQRKEREQQIATALLNSPPLVEKLVAELEGPARALLTFLIYKQGWCPLAVLNQEASGPAGENYTWPEQGTATPAGALISRALAMAGQTRLNDTPQGVLLVPKDLRGPVREALEAVQSAGDTEQERTRESSGRWHVRRAIERARAETDARPAEYDAESPEGRVQDLVAACLYFYGALDLNDLYQQVQAIEPLDLDAEAFRELVARGGENSERPHAFAYADGIAYNCQVEDAEGVLAAHKLREAVPFRTLGRSEAMALAGAQVEKVWSGNILRLYDWVRDHLPEQLMGLDKESYARAFIADVIDAVRRYLPPTEVAQMLADEVILEDIAQANNGMRLLTDMWNDVPMWALKGWSPVEFNEKVAAAESMPANAPLASPGPKPVRPGRTPTRSLKIGRNQPCPCGSGKKYKHCCGAGI